MITFLSKKVVQTGRNTIDVQGSFTIRGVSRPETPAVIVSGVGTGSGRIEGTMAFERKDYGMNSAIPFIRIADRVEVTVDLKVKRLSGPQIHLSERHLLSPHPVVLSMASAINPSQTQAARTDNYEVAALKNKYLDYLPVSRVIDERYRKGDLRDKRRETYEQRYAILSDSPTEGQDK